MLFFVSSSTKEPTIVISFTTKDFKAFNSAKRNQGKIEAHFGERVTVQYAKDGFVYVSMLTSMRRFGCKMRGTNVARSFPIV